MGHPLRNFWQKKPGQVRSPSYGVIIGAASDRLFKNIVFSATGLATIAMVASPNGSIMFPFQSMYWLEWEHYEWIGQYMTKCDLWHCIMTFQRSSEVSDLGWPHAYQEWIIWWFWGFPEVLRPKTWLIVCMDMFIVPLYTLRCQSVPLSQFAPWRFCQ